MSYEDREQLLEDLGYTSFREAAHYERENDDDEITQECAACGDELCEGCPQFQCEECGEHFCDAHKVAFDDFNLCPHCAGAFVEDARNEMRRAMEVATERRLNGGERRVA